MRGHWLETLKNVGWHSQPRTPNRATRARQLIDKLDGSDCCWTMDPYKLIRDLLLERKGAWNNTACIVAADTANNEAEGCDDTNVTSVGVPTATPTNPSSDAQSAPIDKYANPTSDTNRDADASTRHSNGNCDAHTDRDTHANPSASDTDRDSNTDWRA